MVTDAKKTAIEIEEFAANELDEECRLVHMAKAGDNLAFAHLYDAHLSQVYRHIYYLVRDACDAEDLTAQTFLRAWLAISRYEERGRPIAAWFLRIGHNEALSYLRSRRGLAVVPDSFPESGVPVDEQAERRSDEDAVRRALAELPAEQRLVITLRFGEGLKHERVAQIIGKKAPNVRVIQHRALLRLRRMLTQVAPGGQDYERGT